MVEEKDVQHDSQHLSDVDQTSGKETPSTSFNQPKKSHKGLVIGIVSAVAVIAVGATLGVVLSRNKTPVVYDETNELFDENGIKEIVESTNYKVTVGQDFYTTLSIKQDKKSDYKFDIDDINSIKVFTLKETNSTERVRLQKDQDYKLQINEYNCDLEVFGKSITNKLYLNITLREPFSNIIIWEDKSFAYDGTEHSVEFGVVPGKEMPNDAKIVYTLNKGQEIKTHPDHFTFTDEGHYEVKMDVTSAKTTGPYSKTINVSIQKQELPDEIKAKIGFDNRYITKGTQEVVTFHDNNTEDKYKPINTPVVEYKVDGIWTSTVPTTSKTYETFEIRVVFDYKYYKTYTISSSCYLIPYGYITTTFDVKTNEGYWDSSKADNNDKITDYFEVPITGLPFSTIKKLAKIEASPYKEGFTFIGWYRGDSDEEIKDSDIITDTNNFTVKAKFAINTYDIKAIPTEGAGIEYKVNSSAKYGEVVKVTVTKLNDTHKLSYLYVNNQMIQFTKVGEVYEASFTMPAKDVDVYIVAVFKEQGITYLFYNELIEVYDKTEKIQAGTPFTFKYKDKEAGFKVKYIYCYDGDSQEEEPEPFKEIENTKPEEEINVLAPANVDNVIVILISVPDKHVLSFDANGGETRPEDVGVYYCQELLETVKDLSATHKYTAFKCWTKTKDDITTAVNENDTMPNNDLTLYAYWYKYNFQYADGTHGTVSGTTTYNDVFYLNSDSLANLVVTPTVGYYFTGNFEVYVNSESSPRLITNLSEPLTPGKFEIPVKDDNAKIYLKPICEKNTYNVSYDENGGTIANKDKLKSILYGDKVLDCINKYEITATHPHAKFKKWTMYNGTEYVDIDENTIMPANPVTIKPVWETYNFYASATEGGTIQNAHITGKYQVYSDDFIPTAKSGYRFDHLEYSFDPGQTKTYKEVETIPFSPFDVDKTLTDQQSVYIKVVFVQRVTIFLFAGEGTFKNGSNFKTYEVDQGCTWGEIVGFLEKPSKEGKRFYRWVDEQGNPLEDSRVIEDSITISAVYGD